LGFEREWQKKPAGLRTHMLVGLSSTAIVFLGDKMLANFATRYPEAILAADPIRLMQAIVLGISFIGAGTIIQNQRGEPENLTTAASVLFVALIGCAVGVGAYTAAIGLTAAGLLVTAGLRVLSKNTFTDKAM
jgi:putative Mg2+ transporter-C (MgtC) family protein